MCNANNAFGYLYNMVFWLSGATLVGVGTYVFIEVSTYIDLIGKQWIAVALAFIGVGGLIIVSSFIGGFSASSDSRVWVNIYMVLLWITLLLEISGAVITVLFQDEIANQTEKQLTTTILSYDYLGTDDLTKEWDSMQKTVQCCGATNYTQWFALTPYVPMSCCIGDNHCSVKNDTAYQSIVIFTDDCVHKVTDLLELYALIVWSSGFCVAFVTMLGIVLFFCLRFHNCTNCCATKIDDPTTTNA